MIKRRIKKQVKYSIPICLFKGNYFLKHIKKTLIVLESKNVFVKEFLRKRLYNSHNNRKNHKKGNNFVNNAKKNM